MKLQQLTREILQDLYLKDKKSLQEIAGLYGVSRAAVYKKLKNFDIKQRSKSEARLEAQKQHKLPQEYFGINEAFFDAWSVEMAYVLGLLITDGCITKGGVVSLCMNDRELLEKVKKVLGAQHKIVASRHQPKLFMFHFAREHMVKRLFALGVTPRKSLTVRFPDVPVEYLADFIRGVFDGDGSVMFKEESKCSPLVAKFFSGSKDFIEKLELKLQELGLSKRTIYRQKTKNGLYYTIVYGHKDSQKLFEILYKNSEKGMFLERKYNKFLKGIKRG